MAAGYKDVLSVGTNFANVQFFDETSKNRGPDSAAWFQTHIVHVRSIIAGLASQHAMAAPLLRLDPDTAMRRPTILHNRTGYRKYRQRLACCMVLQQAASR